MAGIYVHIPFCKQKCSYCDFHFSTSLKHKSNLINALTTEIVARKEQLSAEINTIYFGGGTPSLLTNNELRMVVEAIYKNYNVANNIEFTLESNPDDLTLQKIKDLKNLGVNRLSIGVQSFFDEDLIFFNRAHCAKQAEQSILMSQDHGFENITIDLIYNTPTLTMQKWESNLDKIWQLSIPHLSAYTLTVEPNTILHHRVMTNQTIMPSDEQAIEQFKLLVQKTKNLGLTQYEVSNFGKTGYFSQHNSNYWKGEEYLGIGPSAHSYTGNKRWWNLANNNRYINALETGEIYFEEELIDERTAFNEYILTRLRTIWGIDMAYLRANFNKTFNDHFEKELQPYLNSSYIEQQNNKIVLTNEGIMIADKITADLFCIA